MGECAGHAVSLEKLVQVRPRVGRRPVARVKRALRIAPRIDRDAVRAAIERDDPSRIVAGLGLPQVVAQVRELFAPDAALARAFVRGGEEALIGTPGWQRLRGELDAKLDAWTRTQSAILARDLALGQMRVAQEVLAEVRAGRLSAEEGTDALSRYADLLPHHVRAILAERHRLISRGDKKWRSKIRSWATSLRDYRARSIAQTEQARATAAGRKAVYELAQDRGLIDLRKATKSLITAPTRAFRLTGRAPIGMEPPCKVCIDLEEQGPTGYYGSWTTLRGEEFSWGTVHPFCRCTIEVTPYNRDTDA